MLPATRNDLSHEERQAKKGALVRKFKLGIDGLQENTEGVREGKYADILATSFRPKTNASPSPNPANGSFLQDKPEVNAMTPLTSK